GVGGTEVSVLVTAGRPIFIQVGGAFDLIGNFVLSLSLGPAPVVANDECASALPLMDGLTVGSTVGATTSTNVPLDTCEPVGSDAWYRYVAAASGLLTVSTYDSGGTSDFDARLAGYSGDCSTPSLLAFGDLNHVPLWEPKLQFFVI